MKMSTKKIITGSELSMKEIAPTKWIIPSLLPEGLLILAAPPKTGKSFLALNLAISVASGSRFLKHYKMKQRNVLYISFEDSEARIQERLITITESQQIDPPKNLFISTDLPKISNKNLNELENIIVERQAELVIIDPYAVGIKRNERSQNVYYDDYNSNSPLSNFAKKLNVCLLIIHHTNKENKGKGLTKVSGSYGFTAAADTVWILNEDGRYHKLEIEGKDIEKRNLQLDFDGETYLWSLIGYDNTTYMTPEQKEIYNLLKAEGRSMKASEISSRLNKKDSTVGMLLRKMTGVSIEKIKYGEYAVIPETAESAESFDLDDLL